MINRRHRPDGNHWPILAALRRVTLAVDVHHSSLGADILARHIKTGAPMLLELKRDAKAKLTDKEQAFAAMFPGYWHRCDNLDDALRAVGVIATRPETAP